MYDKAKHGVIFSPLWPLPYPDDVDCIWTVSVRDDQNIKLSMYDFDVQGHVPCTSFVEIRTGYTNYEGAKPIHTQEQCGQEKPFSVVTEKSKLYVAFKSTNSSGHRGFVAGFVV
ncbi:predicted protein, partial [Nematostella vectensis]